MSSKLPPTTPITEMIANTMRALLDIPSILSERKLKAKGQLPP